MRFAEVAVDAPAGFARTFSYSIPQEISVQPGQLVRVPFGAQRLQGMVFSLEDTPQVPQTRDILGVASAEPLLTGTQLKLAAWISGYYMCPLMDAAALMFPPGRRVRPRAVLSLGEHADDDDLSLTPLQQRVLDYVRRRGQVDETRLAAALGESARASAGSLARRGVLERQAQERQPAGRPLLRKRLRLVDGGGQGLHRWLDETERNERQTALAERLLADGVPLLLSEANARYGNHAVNRLVETGWVEKEDAAFERDPLAGRSFQTVVPPVLTPGQEEVAKEIRAALADESASPRAFLLQGVTGSGKTEVYLDAVDECRRLGRRAIALVPEIALTHQTIERFSARFPGRVAVLHSGLAAGERFDQWHGIRRGDYDVVVGTRSALFAPQPDLGLVVIDEEHDWNYKEASSSPRYHARDVALKLSELSGAALVMGSATPDVGTYYMGRRRQIDLRLLPHRVRSGAGPSGPEQAPLARVSVVDMKEELRAGNRGMFSRGLTRAIERNLASGEQIILFLNRRGAASFRQCRSCGFRLRCRRCDVSLAYHNTLDRLLCHYCGYRRRASAKCPSCLGFQMAYYGFGVQSLEEEIGRLFPGVRVARWDSDAVSGARSHARVAERFESGEAEVLVGTQMVTKGLHFPSVTLVGVVSADVGLNIPDFRAGERSFQILCQVAGRAGRGANPGTVIVQSYQPDNYAVAAAAAQDYQRFYRQEMAYRYGQANPPYTKLIRLVYSHLNTEAAEAAANRFARALREQREAWGLSDVDLLGPTPAYPARLRARYRWQVLLRGPEPRSLLDTIAVPHGWTVDVDPATLA